MDAAVAIFLTVAVVAANLPWIGERVLFLWRPAGGEKKVLVCWAEWLLLLALTAVFGAGLEKKTFGEVYPQGWEFYISAVCLFVVFALPGFIYRIDLRHRLLRR